MGFYPTVNLLKFSDTFSAWGRSASSWFSTPSFGNFWSRSFNFSNFLTPQFNSFSRFNYSFPRFTSWKSSYTPLNFSRSYSSYGSYSFNRGTSLLERNYFANRSTTYPRFGSLTTSRSYLSSTPRSSSYRTASTIAPASTLSVARTVAPTKVSASFKQRLKDLGPEFLNKVKRIAKNINCNYEDLLAVMNAESGLNHTIQNTAGHHYYGLIQFGNDAARLVGTTTSKLVRMSALEQLDYVEKYFLLTKQQRGLGNKKLDAADLYTLVFAPAKVKGNVLYTKAANPKAYNANKAIDTLYGNGDGVISKSDLLAYMKTKTVNPALFTA